MSSPWPPGNRDFILLHCSNVLKDLSTEDRVWARRGWGRACGREVTWGQNLSGLSPLSQSFWLHWTSLGNSLFNQNSLEQHGRKTAGQGGKSAAHSLRPCCVSHSCCSSASALRVCTQKVCSRSLFHGEEKGRGPTEI